MMPEGYIHMMYVKFVNGETMYFKPHTFSMLDMSSVDHMFRTSLPKDAPELKGSNKDCPNIYWGYPWDSEPEGDLCV